MEQNYTGYARKQSWKQGMVISFTNNNVNDVRQNNRITDEGLNVNLFLNELQDLDFVLCDKFGK